MSRNIIQFVQPGILRDKAREKACMWLSRIDAGTMQDVDYEKLQQWLAENDLHLKTFFEMARHWDRISILAELSEIFPLEKYASGDLQSTRRNRFLVAAAVAFLIVCSSLVYLDVSSGQADISAEVAHFERVYATKVGEKSVVTLSDGSEVILNTNTEMQVNFTSDERNIILEHGEALFHVTKDTQRPFRVFAGLRVVEAVGTAFTVQRTTGDDLEVMVTEGVVNYKQLDINPVRPGISDVDDAVLETEKAVSLEAGEFLAAFREQVEIPEKQKIQPDEIEVRLAWQHGMLLFQGEPLEKVLQEVGRYTTIQIDADEEIRNISVEGYFRTGDVDSLLTAIQNNFEIRVQRINDNQIRLTSLSD